MESLDRVVACLGERNGSLVFVESPLPALRGIKRLAPSEQAKTVRKIAEFGLFLEKEKGAVEAAALLLSGLEQVSEEIIAGRPR